ncbi:MAG: hypothetical protein EOP91_03890 [Lysobacteraceae bacterium]|nr:MAG: hypothetical protein EOP91_03890 [Xanthomonadaceae bacterium]
MTRRGRSGALLCVMILLAATATASEVAALRKQVVASMRLTGTLAIDAEGSVTGYAIDQPGRVPPEVLGHLARNVPRWKLVQAPAAGEATSLPFSVRVMAAPREAGLFELSLVGATIRGKRGPGEEVVVRGGLRRPEYPRAVARLAKVTGTVYVVLKVGRRGAVEDLVIEQVNLDFVGEPAQVAQVQAEFAAQAAAAARHWKFKLPVAGALAAEPFLTVRVPVRYVADMLPRYGQWEYYLPGPRRVAPWMQEDIAVGAGEEGVPELLGAGPRLLTPLEPPAG